MAHAQPVLASLDDLAARGLPAASLDAIPSEVQLAHIEEASAIAVGYLAKRFGTPISKVGGDVKGAVCAIAAWKLLVWRGFDPTNAADQAVAKRHDDAVAWLRDVSRGLAEPAGITDATPTQDEASPLVEGEAALGWSWPSAVDEVA